MSTDSQPIVTIAIPTYNRAETTLPLALSSALAQTYPALEVLVSDNASTDSTEELITGLNDERIRYIRHAENMLANDNFNYCLDQARGTWFLLLHDDDLIDRDFVSTCVSAAAGQKDVGIVRTGLRTISDLGEVLEEFPNEAEGETLGDFVDAWFAHRTTPFCCNTLLHTSALREEGGFWSRHRLFQDVRAHVRVAARRRTINVSEVLASFRRHPVNMGSRSRVRDWCEDSLDLLDSICDLLPERGPALRKDGQRFFAWFNYSHVLGLNSPLARMQSYLMVARLFGFARSPLTFAYRKEIRPKLRTIAKKIIASR